METEIAGFPGFGPLGEAWRRLEEEAAPFSFFQSWTWVGCLAEERFPDPVLVRATEDGRTVGLALFNRRGRVLHLTASGDPVLDAVYVEHNGPLIARDLPPASAGRLLNTAWAVPGVRRLVLSGVPPDLLEGVGGATLRARIEQAPFIDLAAITDGPGDFLASRSRNTRYQIRRAMRHFAQRGPLGISRPTSAAEAEAWLDAMIALHTSTWQARGQPGAFATAFLCRFHRVLVQRAHAQGELDLLRISAGGEVIGYLYNFRHRGAVYAYQSGFRQEPGTPQARPGLTSHALAIEEARAAGLSRYDFLAGAARYKLSLANAAARLSWNERVPEASLIGLLARGQGILEGLRERWRGD